MQARRTEAETFRAAPSGRRMLAADGCASSLSNPACCFCAVWAPAGRGEWRSPCSATLVWACSSAEMSALGPSHIMRCHVCRQRLWRSSFQLSLFASGRRNTGRLRVVRDRAGWAVCGAQYISGSCSGDAWNGKPVPCTTAFLRPRRRWLQYLIKHLAGPALVPSAASERQGTWLTLHCRA
jgi:hypothetical protein